MSASLSEHHCVRLGLELLEDRCLLSPGVMTYPTEDFQLVQITRTRMRITLTDIRKNYSTQV
jgi:hypothetical protein